APQQLDASAGHLFLDAGDDAVEVGVALFEGRTFGRDVAIVKGEERRAELLEELEGDLQLQLRRLERALHLEPGPVEGAGAEHVRARPRERVPVANGAAQMLGDGFAEHHAVFVVVTKGQRICALWPLVADRFDAREKRLTHVNDLTRDAPTWQRAT